MYIMSIIKCNKINIYFFKKQIKIHIFNRFMSECYISDRRVITHLVDVYYSFYFQYYLLDDCKNYLALIKTQH
jgi:hypothetical protein